jgi:hypothetical protein
MSRARLVDVNSRRPRQDALLAASAFLSLGMVGCSSGDGIDHIQVSGETAAPPEVIRVSEVAWEWEAPEESLLRNALPARTATGLHSCMTDTSTGR